jgi:hypothetical protein
MDVMFNRFAGHYLHSPNYVVDEGDEDMFCFYLPQMEYEGSIGFVSIFTF